jgi:hypothetical protein
MEFQVGASHERLGGYPAKFDMEFRPFATLHHDPTASPTRVLQERCGNRRDGPLDGPRLQRAYDLFEKTEANFLANVRRGRFKALTKKLPEVLNDSRKLWRHLWRCKEFMKYRQR